MYLNLRNGAVKLHSQWSFEHSKSTPNPLTQPTRDLLAEITFGCLSCVLLFFIASLSFWVCVRVSFYRFLSLLVSIHFYYSKWLFSDPFTDRRHSSLGRLRCVVVVVSSSSLFMRCWCGKNLMYMLFHGGSNVKEKKKQKLVCRWDCLHAHSVACLFVRMSFQKLFLFIQRIRTIR